MLKRNFHITNPEAFVNMMDKYACGDGHIGILPADAFEIPFSETEEKEYEPPKDWPDCCNFHRELKKAAENYLVRFPLCCKHHEKLLTQPWFNKNKYRELPKKIIDTFSHTEYHIHNNMDAENWYQDITDYFEYALTSFGQLPAGFGPPVGLQLYYDQLKWYLKTRETIPEDKRNSLLQYLESYGTKVDAGPMVDINALIGTYKKWLGIFPFEISYFNHLKPIFEHKLPILAERPVENVYMGFAKAKLQTIEGLMTFLVAITERILTEINGLVLHEQGQLTNVQKLRLEVVNARRRIELKQLTQNKEEKKVQYARVLKQWFKGEARYLKEIQPILKGLSKASKPAPAEVVNLSELKENCFCKAMPLQVAIDHFKVFTTTPSTNGKPFLSIEQLAAFIARAFGGKKEIGKQHFNVSSREKQFIVSRFHQFYALAVRDYENTSQCTPKYIGLLTDNFDNWSGNSIKQNFSKSVRRKW